MKTLLNLCKSYARNSDDIIVFLTKIFTPFPSVSCFGIYPSSPAVLLHIRHTKVILDRKRNFAPVCFRARSFGVSASRTRKLLQMDRSLFDARQIVPSMTRKWCVLVQVVERRNAKKKDNGHLYRNYIVTDMKGTKVPIIVFDKNVAFFSNTLQPFKRYYVSNTTVKETPPQYKVVEYPYTWTLYRRNLVEPHPETIPPSLPCTFHFDEFTDFYRYADQERGICIKALVVKALPVQESDESSSLRDFVIINEEMVPMLMRVWDDLLVDTDVNVHARYKIPTLIVGYGLKVTTLNGLSLRTKTNAYFLENPPLKEELPLKEWYGAHTTEITTLIENRAYRDPARLFHPPRPSEILPLDFALASIESAKAVWTEGTLTYLPAQEKIWFEACEKCFTPLDVDTDWKIMCSTCQEYTKVTVRSDVGVFLSHGTTVVTATIKSPEIDKLLPFTGNQLRLAAEENKPLTRKVEAALEKKHIICFLKYYDRASRGTMLRRYPILKIYTEAEIHEYHAAQQTGSHGQIAYGDPTPFEHIGSSSCTPNAAVEKEFFTPTTKAVLEEVARIPSLGEAQPDESTGTKRMLNFEEMPSGKTIDSTTAEIPSCLSPAHPSDTASEDPSEDPTHTTPSKKFKGKDKQT